MRGNDELTAVKPRRIFYKLCQLFLELGGQAVFRLVKQIQRVFTDAVGEISERTLSIGCAVEVLGQPPRDIHRFGAALALVEPLEGIVIRKRAQRHGMHLLCSVVFRKQLITPPVNAGVDCTQIEEEVEYIIAGDDRASLRHPPCRCRYI